MNIHRKGITVALSIMMFLGVGVAHAITITSLGTWHNPTGNGLGLGGAGTDTISWGNGIGGGSQSSYNFAGNGGVVVNSSAIDGTQFKLGDFTHNNFPIACGGCFTGVDLKINLDIANGVSFNQDFTFTFAHNETTNAPPCAVGSPPCPDIVTIPSATATEIVSIGGMDFALTIDGFMTSPGGAVISQFVTDEGQSNSAMLFGSLNRVAVPEPGVITLLGVGLLGLVRFRKQLHSEV